MAIITKIEIQKKNKERVNIYLDEEYAFSISAELVYKENLKVKDVVDIEKLKSVADKESYLRCKNSALKIIERSYKTEKEVIEKLQMKGYEQNHIEASIQKSENDTYKISGKLYRFLISKGYTYDVVKEVVKDVMSIDEFE